MAHLTEFVVEQAVLAWLESLDWAVKHGFEIGPGEPFVEGPVPTRYDSHT